MTQPTCVCYYRVSTERQAEKWSLPAMRRALREHAERQGWKIAGEFEDPGVSGSTISERPGVQALLERVRRGVDFVLVIELERISRGGHGDWDTILAACVAGGAKLATPSTILDPTNVEDAFLSDLFAALSRRERRKTAQRSIRGSVERARSGRACGKPPFGYTIGADGRLAIREDEAAVVRTIFRRTLERAPLLGIADELSASGAPTRGNRGRWHPSQVRRVLHSAAVRGDMVYRPTGGDEVLVADAHPAIVDRATASRAVSLLVTRTFTGVPQSRWSSTYVLTALATCECGRRMFGAGVGKAVRNAWRFRYYRHQLQDKTEKLTCKRVQAGPLEQAVLARVAAALSSRSIVDEVRRLAVASRMREGSDDARRRVELQDAIDAESAKSRTLYADRVAGIVTPEQFREWNLESLDRLEHLRGELRRVEDTMLAAGRGVDVDRLVAVLDDGPRVLAALEPAELKEVLGALLERVQVTSREPLEFRLDWRVPGLAGAAEEVTPAASGASAPPASETRSGRRRAAGEGGSRA